MMNSEKLVLQYEDLKTKEPDTILLMQVGAFMQLMNEDAKTLSQLTGLKLKMGGTPEKPYVTGGFPKSGLDAYIGKLLRAGQSVAIAFQDENKTRIVSEVIRLKAST
ncbi:hypothetical protein WDW89_02830 [Deltaproteobacteria bacterium TL4]